MEISINELEKVLQEYNILVTIHPLVDGTAECHVLS